MSGKGNFFILLLIIAILSLALAVMAGLFFFTSDTKSEDTPAKKEVKVPKDSELSEYVIEKKAYNLRDSAKSETQSFIQISAVVKYYTSIDSIKDLVTSEKITLNQAAILEIFSKYFQHLTLEDVKSSKAMDLAKKNLTKQINKKLVENEEYKVNIVYTIDFSEWLYQ